MTLNGPTRWFDSFLLLNPGIVYFVALHHSHNGPDVAIRAAHLASELQLSRSWVRGHADARLLYAVGLCQICCPRCASVHCPL